jgi:hypothetical protein
MAMKKYLAMGLVCCLPTGLSAVDPAQERDSALGTVNVFVLEESAAIASDVLCTRGAGANGAGDCMVAHQAVLTARLQKVSLLRERGRWM